MRPDRRSPRSWGPRGRRGPRPLVHAWPAGMARPRNTMIELHAITRINRHLPTLEVHEALVSVLRFRLFTCPDSPVTEVRRVARPRKIARITDRHGLRLLVCKSWPAINASNAMAQLHGDLDQVLFPGGSRGANGKQSGHRGSRQTKETRSALPAALRCSRACCCLLLADVVGPFAGFIAIASSSIRLALRHHLVRL